MKSIEENELQFDMERIWLRYNNLKFVVMVVAVLSIAGALVGMAVPRLGSFIIFSAWGILWFFWMRYCDTPCPRCGQPFAHVFWKQFFGLMRPTKCRNCGLSASVRKDAVEMTRKNIEQRKGDE